LEQVNLSLIHEHLNVYVFCKKCNRLLK
jgi:hypothetical protein